MLVKVAVPSGKCPITLDDPTREGVIEWATLLRARGLKIDKHYMVEALVYWSKEFDCVDPRQVKEWLIEEWPDERPLTPREWNKLMLDKGPVKTKEAKEARKEAKEADKAAKKEAAKEAKEAGPKKRWLVFGSYPVTAVLRWMGKNGMTFEQARKACSHLGCEDVSDITLNLQLKAGAKGERGEPAALTAEESAKVLSFAGPVEPKEVKSRVKYTVFGIPAVAVCRTLGAKKWEFDNVSLALETLGCKGMSHATMRMHFVAGQKKNNRWGEPAKLTKKQLDKLTEAAK